MPIRERAFAGNVHRQRQGLRLAGEAGEQAAARLLDVALQRQARRRAGEREMELGVAGRGVDPVQVEIGRRLAAAERAASAQRRGGRLAGEGRADDQPLDLAVLEADGERRMEQRQRIAMIAARRRPQDIDLARAEAAQRQARFEEIRRRHGQCRLRHDEVRSLRVGDLDPLDGHVEGDEAGEAGDGDALVRIGQRAAQRRGQQAPAGRRLRQREGERQQQQQPREGAARQRQRSASFAHHVPSNHVSLRSHHSVVVALFVMAGHDD